MPRGTLHRIIAALILAVHGVLGAIGTGLHALPGCGHCDASESACGHSHDGTEPLTSQSHSSCSHRHAPQAANASVIPNDGDSKKRRLSGRCEISPAALASHQCGICRWYAQGQLSCESTEVPVAEPFLGSSDSSYAPPLARFVRTAHAPRGPPRV